MLNKDSFIKVMHMAASVSDARAVCKSPHSTTYWKLEQCSSNVFVMVHPKRCFDELMHPIYLNPCTLYTDTSPT